MIVEEPYSLCKTDLHYIEDAADELESKCDEIARLTAERDEARREVCEMLERDAGFLAQRQAASRGWDCFKEEAANEGGHS